MSFLTPLRATRRALPTSLRPAYTVATSTPAFHTASARRGLKEDDQNRDDLPNVYEEEKQAQLKRNKEGKGTWNQNLASSSEASVKADRGEVQDHKDFIDLQDRTKRENEEARREEAGKQR